KQIPIVRVCLLPSAYCFLPTVHLEFVVLIIVVQVVFFDDIQLYWIESHHLELDTAFLTGNAFAFISVRIHMDIRITLGTCSSRHFFTSNKNMLSSDTSHAMR